MSAPIVGCEIDSFEKMLKEHPKLLLYFKQEGCGSCVDFEQTLKEISPQLKDLEVAAVDLSEGEEPCGNLADKHAVKVTPTIFFYENGVKKTVWYPSTDKQDVKAQLMKFAGAEKKGVIKGMPLPSSWEL